MSVWTKPYTLVANFPITKVLASFARAPSSPRSFSADWYSSSLMTFFSRRSLRVLTWAARWRSTSAGVGGGSGAGVGEAAVGAVAGAGAGVAAGAWARAGSENTNSSARQDRVT